jgi:hypothetical protein
MVEGREEGGRKETSDRSAAVISKEDEKNEKK